MEKIKTYAVFFYRHHFVRYLFVGGSTFVLDFGLLAVFHGILGAVIAVATSAAYWISILYNFLLNRYWTFDAREKRSLKRHIVTYLMLLIVNYIFVVVFVGIASRHINYLAAKAIAVALQMVWTYPVYKNKIFVSAPEAALTA